MAVNGEAYLFINGWIDFLSLLLAACAARCTFHWGRAVLAALFGSLYAVISWQADAALRGVPVLLLASLLMTALAFGGSALRLFPTVVASAFLFSGVVEALRQWRVPTCLILFVCGLLTAFCCVRQRKGNECGSAAGRIKIVYQGREISLSAIPDSGNLLKEGVTGLPVIVVPEQEIQSLIPAGTRVSIPETLPLGWRLVPVHTASGTGLLMCFHPDCITIIRQDRAFQMDAAIAVSAFAERKALVPESVWNARR